MLLKKSEKTIKYLVPFCVMIRWGRVAERAWVRGIGVWATPRPRLTDNHGDAASKREKTVVRALRMGPPLEISTAPLNLCNKWHEWGAPILLLYPRGA